MAGTTLDWFPLYATTFLASRSNAMMTAEQFGMFMRLLMHQWVDGPLPTDANALLSLCGGNAIALQVVVDRFKETPEGLVNTNLEIVRQEQVEKAEKWSDAGRKAAKSRWLKRKQHDAIALRSQCDGNAIRCHSDSDSDSDSYIPPTPQGGDGEAPSIGVKPEKETDPIPYGDIMAYLNAKTGRTYRAGTGAHRRLIKARWNDGHRLDDFKAVIDNKCADWANSEQEKYLRPETLFGTKFDSYRQQSNGNGGVKVPRETYASLEFEFAEEGRGAAEAWILTQPTAYHDKLRTMLADISGGQA